VLKKGKWIHFVGVGGIGMSGIAELLVNSDYRVSGSDLRRSAITDRLAMLGVEVYEGHDEKYLGSADLVVVSAAVPLDNPECVAATHAGVPIISRGQMLAKLADLKRAVAVVGSHGKTTTTAMITNVLEKSGFDPTAIIGGKVIAFGSNARLGNGPVIVVEADESDRSFLHLAPEIAVLTNIDIEHLDAYDGMDDLEQSFVSFAKKVASSGCVIACGDDRRLKHLLQHVEGRIITYGVNEGSCQVHGYDLVLEPNSSHCNVRISIDTITANVRLQLPVPGHHNIQNALAAFAVGVYLGLSPEEVSAGLSQFTGTERRFQVLGEVNGIVVIDDYAHHPTEIEAVIATARLRKPDRLRVVFQPHRYSRTRRLLEEFGRALAGADDVIVTDVYGAGEEPLSGSTAAAITDAVRRVRSIPVRVVSLLDDLPKVVAGDSRPRDLVVTMGAGSIEAIGPKIVESLKDLHEREGPT
jgi:UDP-N-acetylmuramate--alanine ligase